MSPLFRLSFAFAFSHKMVHSVSAHRKKKGLCGISKSEMLASERDPEGKKNGGWRGGGRGGEGSQCGSRRGKGRDLPQDLVSHRVLLQHYNKIRDESTSEPPSPSKMKQYCKRREEQMRARERVALNPTHCNSPLDSVN